MQRLVLRIAFILAATATTALAQTTPSAVSDIQNWFTLGLPMAAEWNAEGFPIRWHVDQVRAGRRLLPSVFLPLVDYADQNANNPNLVQRRVKDYASDFAYINAQGLPICLRTNNIGNSFTNSPRYRFPAVATNIPKSPLQWRELDTGALDQRPICDSQGPASCWQNEGTVWADTLYMQTLQSLVKSPKYVLFVENNEAAYDESRTYYNAAANPPTWKSYDDIRDISLRMHDRIKQLRGADATCSPLVLNSEIGLKRRDHYAAFYKAFDAALDAGWRAKMYTAGYGSDLNTLWPSSAGPIDQVGYDPQSLSYDAGSPAVYIGDNKYKDFTALQHAEILNQIPAWDWIRAHTPRSYREVSLALNSPGALGGALAKRHAVMTPARYEGYVQWLLWSIHERGVPVILRHFCSSAKMPSDPYFSTSQFKTLDSLGAGNLKNLRLEDYIRPITASVDRVCTNATLRNFWLKGEPVIVPGITPTHILLQKFNSPAYPRSSDPDRRWRVLNCSANKPSSSWYWDGNKVAGEIRVWAVATKLDNQALVYAWTPCVMTGKISVSVPGLGTFQIDAPQPWSYWLVKTGAAPVRVSVN
ncbi:MAG: hypothetical protein ACT4QC_13545 [Planctomycetaceae bacterium]